MVCRASRGSWPQNCHQRSTNHSNAQHVKARCCEFLLDPTHLLIVRRIPKYALRRSNKGPLLMLAVLCQEARRPSSRPDHRLALGPFILWMSLNAANAQRLSHPTTNVGSLKTLMWVMWEPGRRHRPPLGYFPTRLYVILTTMVNIDLKSLSRMSLLFRETRAFAFLIPFSGSRPMVS